MKQLLEDMLLVLNAIPNRKLRGKDWTTYDLAKRVEAELGIKFHSKVLLELTKESFEHTKVDK